MKFKPKKKRPAALSKKTLRALRGALYDAMNEAWDELSDSVRQDMAVHLYEGGGELFLNIYEINASDSSQPWLNESLAYLVDELAHSFEPISGDDERQHAVESLKAAATDFDKHAARLRRMAAEIAEAKP